MHIVYLCSEYPPGTGGGIGAFTQSLARSLVRHGHQATAIGFSRSVDRESVEEDQGVSVIRLPVGSVRGVAAVSEQRRLWRRIHQLAASGATLVEGPELLVLGCAAAAAPCRMCCACMVDTTTSRLRNGAPPCAPEACSNGDRSRAPITSSP